MSEHVVSIEWNLAPHPSQGQTYDRDHRSDYGNGVVVPVSAAPSYLGNDSLPDPEQLLVNALASCHMLFFLALCEGSGYRVTHYSDRAVGIVEKSATGGNWVSTIRLSPKAQFASGKTPNEAALERLHDRAHRGCFIAQSLRSRVIIHPEIT